MTETNFNKQCLQITSICDVKTCVASEITEEINKLDLNLRSMRQVVNHNKSITLFSLTGTWNNINKIETLLKKKAKNEPENIISSIISSQDDTTIIQEHISYHINIVATSDTNLISELLSLLASCEIKVENISLDNHTETPQQIPLVVLNAKVLIDKNYSLSDIRERFLIFCDNLNIDGVLDPIRPI